MAEVTLDIGGRLYDVHCRDGEERQLQRLAAIIDDKTKVARRASAGLTEVRQLLFAAILLVCGLAVAMQVRAQTSETDYSTLRRADLVQLLDDLTAQSRQLESEITDLEATQRQLQSGVEVEQGALTVARAPGWRS